MGWFDSLFGTDDAETGGADEGRGAGSESHDPFGRIVAEPVFDAFRDAWKAGAGLFDLFGSEPVKIKEPVGPEASNRRPDVAKVETFLGRTGHLDLNKTEGPTGYFGGRVDQGIRAFQKDRALKVDGLVNPDGETLQSFGAVLSEGQQPSLQAAGLSPMIGAPLANAETMPERQRPLSTQAITPLQQRVADWFGGRAASLVADKNPAARPASAVLPVAVQRTNAVADEESPQSETLEKSALPEYVATPIGNDASKAAEPAHLRPVLDTIESTYRNRVEGLRRRGMPVAAANLEHFLDGSGEPRKLPREEAIKLAPIKEAEATNIERFASRTFRGDSEKNEIVRQLPSMRLGEGPLHFNDWWERDLGIGNYLWNAALGDRDFAAGIGRVKFRSEGDFRAMRTGDSITISGMVTHRLADTYDFHLWDPGAEGALALQRYRGAKPFAFQTEWRQPVQAIVPVIGGKLGKPKVVWGNKTE